MEKKFKKIRELIELFESESYLSYSAALELQSMGQRYYPAEGRWCPNSKIDGVYHTFK